MQCGMPVGIGRPCDVVFALQRALFAGVGDGDLVARIRRRAERGMRHRQRSQHAVPNDLRIGLLVLRFQQRGEDQIVGLRVPAGSARRELQWRAGECLEHLCWRGREAAVALRGHLTIPVLEVLGNAGRMVEELPHGDRLPGLGQIGQIAAGRYVQLDPAGFHPLHDQGTDQQFGQRVSVEHRLGCHWLVRGEVGLSGDGLRKQRAVMPYQHCLAGDAVAIGVCEELPGDPGVELRGARGARRRRYREQQDRDKGETTHCGHPRG